MNDDILRNYFPALAPDGWGLHLQRAWNMRREGRHAGRQPGRRAEMALPFATVAETPATVWYPKQPPGALAATVQIYRRFLDAAA